MILNIFEIFKFYFYKNFFDFQINKFIIYYFYKTFYLKIYLLILLIISKGIKLYNNFFLFFSHFLIKIS
jgi:hypothetical protein